VPEAIDRVTRDEEQTRQLAARLAAALRASDVVALIGELGSGKTRFVEGACRGLGYSGRVRSPSYTLLNIYRASAPIYHFDLYRWDRSRDDAELAEWEELMDGDGITFVEWADRLGEALPARSIVVRLAHAGERERRVTVSAPPLALERIRASLSREGLA
jgi:tRNA threonylcarbamoyladenosine biosynthesis protein TsaE